MEANVNRDANQGATAISRTLPWLPSEWCRGRLLRQTNPAQQVGVARVGAHLVKEGVYCEIGHAGRMLLVGLFQPSEGLVSLAQARVDYCDGIEVDIGLRGSVLQFFGD